MSIEVIDSFFLNLEHSILDFVYVHQLHSLFEYISAFREDVASLLLDGLLARLNEQALHIQQCNVDELVSIMQQLAMAARLFHVLVGLNLPQFLKFLIKLLRVPFA